MAHHQGAYEYDPYYLHYPHHQQGVGVGPPPAAAPPQDYGVYSEWGISTLFVAGLPDDVKPREIHNLFRRHPGFEYSQLKYTGRGNQAVAFVTFVNHPSALAALHALNGVKFDPQAGGVLHIELARSNSTRQRKPGDGPYVVIDRRNRKPSEARASSSDDGGSDADDLAGIKNLDSDDKGDTATADRLEAQEEHKSEQEGITENASNTEKAVEGGACSTLFIANLGPNCTHDELQQLLSQYPGFNVLKLRGRGGMPVAFADFEGVEQATAVMNELQGSLLESSDRGGMHLEYARSKMRKS